VRFPNGLGLRYAGKFPIKYQYVISYLLIIYTFLTFQGGQWILTLVDFYGGTYVVFILAIFELAGIVWVYGECTFNRPTFLTFGDP